MAETSFSSLIYRIIGKPERWHDEYIVEMMQTYLDGTNSVDDPLNLLELEAGDEILSRLHQGNIAVDAFNTLLDKSRFQIIILDDSFNSIYHNHISESLYRFIQSPEPEWSIKPKLQEEIRRASAEAREGESGLIALDFYDVDQRQIYLRVLASRRDTFYTLMVLDERHADVQLNPDLANRYQLTAREQSIVVAFMHGKSIKEIAEESFTSEATVRTHLKSIFRKTGTNSQASLVSRMLTHESQLLDAYFDSELGSANQGVAGERDRSLRLSCGLEVSYGDYGPEDGRPTIVFHSGFGSRLAVPADWQELCRKVNRRLIIPDRPGLGKTPFVENHPERWNKQLGEFINKLGIQSYDVVGSVIACQMATSFVYETQHKPDKLILTSPVVLNTDEHTNYLTEILSPAAKYVRMSPIFAKEIYELWLKSVTLNLDQHYPTILEQSIGSAEREQFIRDGVPQLLTEVFKEGARNSLQGILHEMVYCMTPLNIDMSQLTLPVEIWYGTEDKRITRKGVDTISREFPNANLMVKEGYSEHLYYALFEEILS